jgi:hypothetical protein
MNVLMGTTEGTKGESGFDLAGGASSFITSSGGRLAPDMMGTSMYFPIRERGGLATGIPLIFFGDQERRDGEVSLFMLFLLVV